MSGEFERSILNIDRLVEALPSDDRIRFHDLFAVSTVVGELCPPESMYSWIEAHFGSVEAVLRQRIVKITNLVTCEGSLFNELRARRPIEVAGAGDIEAIIRESEGDPFCAPLLGTPEDIFGRVEGQCSITASNIAKYDGFHGLVIFDYHNPLDFTAEEFRDWVETAVLWAQRAHDQNEEFKYPFLLWNCLWRGGASIVHGHLQIALGCDMHYAKIESLRRVALAYRSSHGRSYFDDLCRVHRALGLAHERDGTHLLAYLTPVKEKEVLLISDRVDEDFEHATFKALRCFRDRLGVTSFNLAIYMPPLAEVEEDWSGFPVVARLVDRGHYMTKTADIGAMELYAASVIASDPFRVIEALATELDKV